MKLKLLVVVVALSCSTIALVNADVLRVGATAVVQPSSSGGDCDDADRACSPIGDLDGDGMTDSATQAPTMSPKSSGAVLSGGLDDDCDGDRCASSSSVMSPVCKGDSCVSKPSSATPGGMDQDCDGVACVSSPASAQAPSGMAISEQGIPGKKSPKPHRCEGANCPSSSGSQQPSGMAINEKGLPGEKKPAQKKDQKK